MESQPDGYEMTMSMFLMRNMGGAICRCFIGIAYQGVMVIFRVTAFWAHKVGGLDDPTRFLEDAKR
jgi:hypothetical protein